MRKTRVWLHSVLMTILLATLLVGCGGGGVDEAPPPAAQTGDTTLFPNHTLLTSTTTIDTEKGVIILDARSVEAYNAGHIPGAISAPSDDFAEPGSESANAELKAKFGAMGITWTSKIVIYDNTTESLGAGGRLFWMLEYLGCNNVSILNGGWDQWVIQLGHTPSTETPITAAVDFETIATPAPADATISANADQVQAYSANIKAGDATYILVDARTLEEYAGTNLFDTSTSRLGHIPGAINLPYKTCYNPDKTVLNYYDLKQLFDSNNITADKHIIAYSTIGKRSAFIYFLTRLMGYPKGQVANYSGSAKEWASLDATAYPLVEKTTPF